MAAVLVGYNYLLLFVVLKDVSVMELNFFIYQKAAIPLIRLAVGSVLEVVTSVVMLGEHNVFNAVYCLLLTILKQEHTAIRVFCFCVVVYLNIRIFVNIVLRYTYCFFYVFCLEAIKFDLAFGIKLLHCIFSHISPF